MTLRSWLAVAMLVGLCPLSFGQSSVDPEAVKNADAFLAGLKIADIPEGRQAMRAALWTEYTGIYRSTPVVLEQTTLYQGMFDADVQGVQGYKRLLEMKVQSKAKTTLTERYILISYKDRMAGTWKVFGLGELEGLTVERQTESARRDLGDTRYNAPQFNYRRHAYWLALDGKLKEARIALTTAATLNQTRPDKNFSQAESDANLRALRAITGEADSNSSAKPN